jgi:hypothetical protein
MTQRIEFSADGGKTWIRIAAFTENAAIDPMVAYDGVDTYVVACGSTAVGHDDWIFRSTDSGSSFARVTGITGFNLNGGGNIPHRMEYGLSKLWMAADVVFGEGQDLYSSTDDGSSWTEEFDGQALGIGCTFAISGSGILVADKEQATTGGFFDADGVSLPATYTSNFFGLGASWSPHASSARFIFADPNSGKPNRFFANFYNAVSDVSRMYYSDDNGTTWLRSTHLDTAANELSMTTAADTFMFWDGTNYHWICTGSTDYWMWSKDGSLWSPAPVDQQTLTEITSTFSASPHQRICCPERTV